MASQNVPGVAVMKTFGFPVPWRRAMMRSGIATSMVAGFGGHAVNLAAISAALAAGDEAGERSRRWIASLTAAGVATLLALTSGALVAIVSVAPAGIIETVAGLALITTFVTSVTGAFAAPTHRLSSALTFLIAASGMTIAGIGGAFWALVAGLTVRFVLERRPSTDTL